MMKRSNAKRKVTGRLSIGGVQTSLHNFASAKDSSKEKKNTAPVPPDSTFCKRLKEYNGFSWSRNKYVSDDDAEYDLSEELPPVSILDPKSSSTDPPSQLNRGTAIESLSSSVEIISVDGSESALSRSLASLIISIHTQSERMSQMETDHGADDQKKMDDPDQSQDICAAVDLPDHQDMLVEASSSSPPNSYQAEALSFSPHRSPPDRFKPGSEPRFTMEELISRSFKHIQFLPPTQRQKLAVRQLAYSVDIWGHDSNVVDVPPLIRKRKKEKRRELSVCAGKRARVTHVAKKASDQKLPDQQDETYIILLSEDEDEEKDEEKDDAAEELPEAISLSSDDPVRRHGPKSNLSKEGKREAILNDRDGRRRTSPKTCSKNSFKNTKRRRLIEDDFQEEEDDFQDKEDDDFQPPKVRVLPNSFLSSPTSTSTANRPRRNQRQDKMECPICGDFFPELSIEAHASDCNETHPSSDGDAHQFGGEGIADSCETVGIGKRSRRVRNTKRRNQERIQNTMRGRAKSTKAGNATAKDAICIVSDEEHGADHSQEDPISDFEDDAQPKPPSHTDAARRTSGYKKHNQQGIYAKFGKR